MAFGQKMAGRDEPILEPDLPIIDTHHHLFDRPALRYMFDDYLDDCRAGHRIVASVYSETKAFARAEGPEMLRPLGEIEFANGIGAISASGVYGDIRICAGIVGFADFRFGDAIAEYLDQAIQLAPHRMRGIRQVTIDDPSESPYRFITHRPPRGVLQHPKFHEGFRHLAPRNLSFDAAVFHHQLPEIMALADAFPDTIIILNHMGHYMAMDADADGKIEMFRVWRDLMINLAMRPNVVCKVGGLGMPFWDFGFNERKDPVGYQELAAAWRPVVETAIEIFGVHRCMMESNYPPDSRSAGFVPSWNALKHITRNTSANDKAALFHDTAAHYYRISSPMLPTP